MHIYIIYAHPSPESFTAAILREFTRGVSDAGHSFRIHDLYADGFAPLLDNRHYHRETDRKPAAALPDDVREEHSRIQQADALAFVYPVWWSDCPAIMKGWFDRIWTNGFAYSYDNNVRSSNIRPKQALVICTAGHPPEHLEQTGIAPGMRCIMLKDRLENVGFTRSEMVILGGTATVSETLLHHHRQTAYSYGISWFT